MNEIQLGEIIELTKGKKHQVTDDETAFRYLQIEDLDGSANFKFTSENGVLASPDDIIIAWDGANAGKVGTGLSGMIGSTLARMTIRKDIAYPRFIYWFLDSKFEFIKSKRTGATIPHISNSALRILSVPLPPLPEQQRIATILDHADTIRRKNREILEKYNQLAQSVFLEMFGDPVSLKQRVDKKKLKELCTQITDGTHDTPARITTGNKFITGKHIKPFIIDYDNSDYVSEDDHNEIIKRCYPEKGDILYTNIGVNLGTAAMNTVDYVFSMKNVALIKYNRDFIYGRYLESLLNQPSFKLEILRLASLGGAQQFLSLKQIRELEIPIPNYIVQKKYETLFEQIENQKTIILKSSAKSEELFQSLLQRAFRGEL